MPNSIKPLILASQSPRRIELLKEILPDFKIVPSTVEEILQPGLTPVENALSLARQKALSVAKTYPGHYILGADTIVVLDDEIIGKPRDPEEARSILRRLSGREHQVITGLSLINAAPIEEATVSRVHIKPLSEEEIFRYVESGEPMDKAGAYAIQGNGAFMVSSYEGSYSNIVGLPLETTRRLLSRAGYSPS